MLRLKVRLTATPPVIATSVVDLVDGPMIMKVLKSSLIWQMLLLMGQTWAVQEPAVTVEDSK